jgi:hypothetical protein
MTSAPELQRFFFEDALVHLAHGQPLVVHFRFSAQRVKERTGGVDDAQVEPWLYGEELLDRIRIVRPINSLDVDGADAPGLFVYGLFEQVRDHGGIGSARECEEYALILSEFAFERGDFLFRSVLGREAVLCAADIEAKIFEHAMPADGFGHLGMELHAPEVFAVRCRDRRVFRPSEIPNDVGVGFKMISVAFQYGHGTDDAFEQAVVMYIREVKLVHAEFAILRGTHTHAYVLGPHLEAEADTEDRDAQIENARIERRRFRMYGRRASGEDNASGLQCANVFRRHTRRIRHEAKYAQCFTVLSDEVVELTPEGEEEKYFVRLAYGLLLSDLVERFFGCMFERLKHRLTPLLKVRFQRNGAHT